MGVALFRAKPVVIEALQYVAPSRGIDVEVDDEGNENQVEITVPGNIDQLQEWGAPIGPTEAWSDGNHDILVKTLEDGSEAQVPHVASPGDYIVKGTAGEFYPVKPTIFEAKYDRVPE